MTQDFESAVVQGKAHWITSIVHEPDSARLVIWLTDDDVSFMPTRTIEFTDVHQLESLWIDREERRYEGLLGAHEDEVAGFVHYLLVTDQREIRLTTRRKAEIRACS